MVYFLRSERKLKDLEMRIELEQFCVTFSKLSCGSGRKDAIPWPQFLFFRIMQDPYANNCQKGGCFWVDIGAGCKRKDFNFWVWVPWPISWFCVWYFNNFEQWKFNVEAKSHVFCCSRPAGRVFNSDSTFTILRKHLKDESKMTLYDTATWWPPCSVSTMCNSL